MDEDLEQLRNGLITANHDSALSAAERLLDAGVDPRVILESGMATAMFTLGEMWKRGEVFLPEVVASAEIFKRCNAIVEPALLASSEGADEQRVVVIATVKGDLHDLGKNMVGAMLRTSGFRVHDLGKDVAADTIVATVRDLEPSIVGLSALLTTTVPNQETVIKALAREGLRDGVQVMVGGAPVTPEWAEKIGADGYANNAPEAVDVAKKLLGLAQ
jgi:corrinoid protein of di/trimethylamine methyltransferase